MAQIQSDKPIKTIRELLGIDPGDLPMPETLEKKAPPTLDLPVLEEAEPIPIEVQEVQQIAEPKPNRFAKIASKDLVRYPIIFVIALVFFYAILNFSAITSQVGSLFDRPDQPAKPAVPDDFNLAAYQRWVKKYYVYLNDPQLLAPAEDPDRDGLINSHEFGLETNPLLSDTDGDGYDDGREVLGGYNPLYEGRLLPWQEKVIADDIDTIAIASRKQLQAVSGTQILPPSPSPAPAPPSYEQNAAVRAQLPVDNKFLVDVSKPGDLNIPRLGTDVQIVWSKVFEQMEEDLKYGVAHHPATPYPGEHGTVSIHGHSSGNPWDGNFKTIFTKLNFLEAGDEIFVTVYGTNGDVRKYRYMVRTAKVYEKTDSAQFEAGQGRFLNLSTSWPIGTARQRYVVTTELVGIQP
ncbi:MAG: sortase [bacterium]|nr:sortase [bacterium]